MSTWFFVCVLGVFLVVPLHFLSVERLKLQRRYGAVRGTKIGDVLGMISGWGYFLLWLGTLFSPQPSFTIPIFTSTGFTLPYIGLVVPALHLIMFTPLILAGAWLGVSGVLEVSLKVAETHRAERVVTTGVYSLVRHPQYLGSLLAHVGIAILLSAWYSLLFTPFLVVILYLVSRKEEEELVREFDREYEEYQGRVPMLIPLIFR